MGLCGAGRDGALWGGYGVGQVAPIGEAGRFRGRARAPMIWSQSAPLPSLLSWRVRQSGNCSACFAIQKEESDKASCNE